MNAREMVRQLAVQFDAEDGAASDMWTWLPSYASAVKHFGDYACDKRPPAADLMREASMLFSALRGFQHDDDEITEWFYVNTDDVDDPPSDEEKVAFVRAWFKGRIAEDA